MDCAKRGNFFLDKFFCQSKVIKMYINIWKLSVDPLKTLHGPLGVQWTPFQKPCLRYSKSVPRILESSSCEPLLLTLFFCVSGTPQVETVFTAFAKAFTWVHRPQFSASTSQIGSPFRIWTSGSGRSKKRPKVRNIKNTDFVRHQYAQRM